MVHISLFVTLLFAIAAAIAWARGFPVQYDQQDVQRGSNGYPPHKIPRRALTEYKRGATALMKRQFTSARDYFKRAVAIDPLFADAYNDLGVAYLGLKEYALSAGHLQKALELVPSHHAANDNLCISLLKMKRYAEAGQAAKRILMRDAGSSIGHYVAAVSLMARGGSAREALDHASRAENAFPPARILAARILSNSGRPADAAHELEAYLNSSGAASRRPALEAWLGELKR